jgi:hypothetical protein
MNEKMGKLLDVLEEGLRRLHSSHSAFVISEQEEANANNEEDYMQTCAFLNGTLVDLCTKASAKKGYVEVFDITDNNVKTLFGDVKILRWDLVHSKGDIRK